MAYFQIFPLTGADAHYASTPLYFSCLSGLNILGNYSSDTSKRYIFLIINVRV
jgi:hypothetical protein